MLELKELIIFLFIVNKIVCENETFSTNYMGEKFPTQYLQPEDFTPTDDDLNLYLHSLGKVVSHFASEPNRTDVNRAMTLFFLKGVIRKSILDDIDKIKPYQKTVVLQIMSISDYVLSHFKYLNLLYLQKHGIKDNTYRLMELLEDHEVLAKSLPEFNRNKLKQWIVSKGRINDFVEDMDEGTLPKEKYAELVDISCTVYHILISASDTCLARVVSNLAPTPDNKTLQACKPDPYCKNNIHASPSIAYGLSHRMLNLFVYRSVRRCYWVSPQDDELHMDILCAFMYREAVYLARRGYFARDLFMEHVGLCGMRGYMEFYRRHWFKKVIQWIDEDGCIQEDHNFMRNSTIASLQHVEGNKERNRSYKRLRSNLKKQCHSHPMAVLTMFLSNAIRYAMHYIRQ